MIHVGVDALTSECLREQLVVEVFLDLDLCLTISKMGVFSVSVSSTTSSAASNENPPRKRLTCARTLLL